MTADEYKDSLRRLKRRVHLFGQEVADPVEHPFLRPSLEAAALTYELAQDPRHAELMTARSHLDGRTVNRFTHLHRSREDLLKKSRMGRLLGRLTGCCFQRCVGMDALNALSIVTYETDAACGTQYHRRFLDYLRYVQEKDLLCDGAMTDPKGDRSLPPHAQEDPDLYLRVVERRPEGIVVRGAKAHQTGAVNAHEIIVMPTAAMREKDRDYALSFAVPADTPGILFIVGRQSADTRRLEAGTFEAGNLLYGGHEALIVFEDVFVPWERVFLCGEYAFTGRLVESFAAYHRQSYACKAGVGDVLIGAAQTIADYNGTAGAAHVRDKIIEMVHLNETIYCGALACAAEGKPTASGTFLVDVLMANVHKQNVTRFPYEIARLAQDIAGGLLATLPAEKDLRSPVTGPCLEKYLRGRAGVTAERRMRILRLIENLTLGSAAVGYLVESMHGAGSPQTQRVVIARYADLPAKQEAAKRLCGIED